MHVTQPSCAGQRVRTRPVRASTSSSSPLGNGTKRRAPSALNATCSTYGTGIRPFHSTTCFRPTSLHAKRGSSDGNSPRGVVTADVFAAADGEYLRISSADLEHRADDAFAGRRVGGAEETRGTYVDDEAVLVVILIVPKLLQQLQRRGVVPLQLSSV